MVYFGVTGELRMKKVFFYSKL